MMPVRKGLVMIEAVVSRQDREKSKLITRDLLRTGERLGQTLAGFFIRGRKVTTLLQEEI